MGHPQRPGISISSIGSCSDVQVLLLLNMSRSFRIHPKQTMRHSCSPCDKILVTISQFKSVSACAAPGALLKLKSLSITRTNEVGFGSKLSARLGRDDNDVSRQSDQVSQTEWRSSYRQRHSPQTFQPYRASHPDLDVAQLRRSMFFKSLMRRIVDAHSLVAYGRSHLVAPVPLI
jgi:hypothetical protein